MNKREKKRLQVARKRAQASAQKGREASKWVLGTVGKRITLEGMPRKPETNHRLEETLALFAACHSPVTIKNEVKPVPVYTGEMAEREARAQEETARKRLRVAPLYNKGGLQYISDDMDPTTLGRK